jgi:hypothetical protein
MRMLAALLFCSFSLAAADGDEKSILAAMQKLFDGMAAHDAAMIKSAMTADARLVRVRQGKTASTSGDDFATSIAGNKNQLLERIWSPTVLVRGNIAMVWAEYDFHSNGKFHHCGIDAFLMLKTDEGWKASTISDTSETEGCKPSPLGPPKQ